MYTVSGDNKNVGLQIFKRGFDSNFVLYPISILF